MRSAPLVLLTSGLLFAPGRLSAGERAPAPEPSGIKVDPVRLDLSKDEPAKSLTVSIGAGDPAGTRFQVSAFAWSNSDDGDIQLTPTDDVSYFPSLFTLKPKQSRRIRVGVPSQSGHLEKSYRVVLQQLPSGIGGPEAVQMLTRMTLPVFVAPEKAVRAGSIVDAILKDGIVRFTLKNEGTVHLMVPSAHIIGRDAHGSVVFDRQAPGWYILPASIRHFRVDVPADACPKTASVSVEAADDRGTTFKQAAIFADQPCAANNPSPAVLGPGSP